MSIGPRARRLARRGLALLLALLLLVGGSLTVAADRKTELQQQLAELQQKENTIKNQLADAKADRDASQKRKNLLDTQIANVEEQIRLLNSQVSGVEEEITKALAEIEAAQAEIEAKELSISDTKDKLNQRLRAIMKSGNVTMLQMLMNTESYTDYLLKSKAIQCIASHDQQTIDELEEALQGIRQQKDALEARKTELDAKKADLDAIKATATQKKKDLDTLCDAAQTEVRNLQNTVDGYNAQLKANQREMEKANQAIEALINASTAGGSYNNSMMFWPVPTVRVVSSGYGERWNTIHRGIDVSNGPIPIYGENIVAAADGVVIAANYTSTWGYGWSAGYGYACIVDHGLDSRGRRITTLYAHCSVMYARVGQKVTGGKTVLGQAGKTGNVTGPHLHFEVREDGKSVDPIGKGYVSPKVN